MFGFELLDDQETLDLDHIKLDGQKERMLVTSFVFVIYYHILRGSLSIHAVRKSWYYLLRVVFGVILQFSIRRV